LTGWRLSRHRALRAIVLVVEATILLYAVNAHEGEAKAAVMHAAGASARRQPGRAQLATM
jgi:hypothetical protein